MTGTFQVSADTVSGHDLAIDATLVLRRDAEPEARGRRLAEIAEVAYQAGRSSVMLDRTDRHDVGLVVDALRALAVVVGPTPTGDRYRRVADVLAELLRDQESG